MTKIDVREAEAGPALDAACAEAMGWEPPEEMPQGIADATWTLNLTWEIGRLTLMDGREYENKDTGETVPVRVMERYFAWESPSGELAYELPEWSHDIKAAWELVEAMLPLRGAPEPEVEPWWIFTGYLEGRLLGPSERVALHICRAFLLARGVTEIEADRGQSD